MIRDYSSEEQLGIPTDQLAYIALKARAFDAEVDVPTPNDASNDVDDQFAEALESSRDNPTRRELSAAINSLNEEAQATLVALVWLGRGDFAPADWDDAVKAALERRQDGPAARYLLGIPMLGDLLEEGANELGFNLTEDEQDGLYHAGAAQTEDEDRT